jgi:hypothetical protein
MSIWFIVIATVLANGDVAVDTRYPNSPDYNNEKDCNAAGQAFVDQEQMKLGTSNGTIYFICKQITTDEIRNATSKGNGA